MKVAWLIQNLVPYHHARFEAFSRREGIDGHLIQVTDRDSFGILEFKPERRSYDLHTLFAGRDRSSISPAELQDELEKTLSTIGPDCVCASGWGMEIGWQIQAWALGNHVPVVMFSESTSYDEERRRGKEWIKSRLVKACGAALVGGTPHKEYICNLGMSPDSVFLGHNAVDGSHFAAESVSRPPTLPEWLERESYFVCCTRFGEKKNLPRLVRAYAQYAGRCESEGKNACKLVIAGDGDLRAEIEQTIAVEKITDRVVLLGAVGYDSLPWLYQHSRAFIHASTTEQWGLVVNEAMAAGAPVLVSNRCGCAVDLVQDGVNGFQFDPYSERDIADALWRFEALEEHERQAMGMASRRIIADWTPDRFANGLGLAVDRALHAKIHRHATTARWTIRLLLAKEGR